MLSEGFKSKEDHCFFCLFLYFFFVFFLIRSFLLKIISLISDIRLAVKGLPKVIKNRSRKTAVTSEHVIKKVIFCAFKTGI